jgi:hypothetical protein
MPTFGETKLKAFFFLRECTAVQRQRPSDVVEAAPARVLTLDPHGQAVPGCAASSASPDGLCNSVRLVKSDLRGCLETTMIDVMQVKQAS